jgi:hypothetical protein
MTFASIESVTSSLKTEGPWRRENVDSWLELQRKLEQFLTGTWLFRGVTSVRHSLIASVGRRHGQYIYSSAVELDLFEQFKREALPFMQSRPANDWEWLALAQHQGLPTRLLDWSESPFVSLFFAVWGNDEDDAGLYIVPRPKKRGQLELSPLEQNSIAYYYPGYVTARLVSQRGVFTVHPNPTEVYIPDGIIQFVIDRSLKLDFRQKLDAVGVHHAAIFADLGGLSQRLSAIKSFAAQASPETVENPAPKASSGRKPNPLDPQKGQWGGKPESNGWKLSAIVHEITPNWYSITLAVDPNVSSAKVLTDSVFFYLHDSFKEPVVEILPVGNKAMLETSAYGAFTVGCLVRQDGTQLELDLAELESAPKRFREQ